VLNQRRLQVFVQPEAGVSVEDANGRILSVQRIGLNDPHVAGRAIGGRRGRRNDLRRTACRSRTDDWARQSSLPDAYALEAQLAYRRRLSNRHLPERSCAIAAWICSPHEILSPASAPALQHLSDCFESPAEAATESLRTGQLFLT
jgi:hypothetical protein